MKSLRVPRCLGDLIDYKMSSVSRGLRKSCCDWQLVSVQWFLCLYVNCLPLETTLRVWDVFFYEGSVTLFRIALALIKQSGPQLKGLSDSTDVMMHLREAALRSSDCDALFNAAFRERACAVNFPELQRLRRKHGEKTQKGGGPHDSSWLAGARSGWSFGGLLRTGNVSSGGAKDAEEGGDREMGEVGDGGGLFRAPSWHAEVRGAGGLLNEAVIDGYIVEEEDGDSPSGAGRQASSAMPIGEGEDEEEGAVVGGGAVQVQRPPPSPPPASRGERLMPNALQRGAAMRGGGGKPSSSLAWREGGAWAGSEEAAGGHTDGEGGEAGWKRGSDDGGGWPSEEEHESDASGEGGVGWGGARMDHFGFLDTPPPSAMSTPERRAGGARREAAAKGEGKRGKEWEEPQELHAVMFDKVSIVEGYCFPESLSRR